MTEIVAKKMEDLFKNILQKQSKLERLQVSLQLLSRYYDMNGRAFVKVAATEKTGSSGVGDGDICYGIIMGYDVDTDKFHVATVKGGREDQQELGQKFTHYEGKAPDLTCVAFASLPDSVVSKLLGALPAYPEPVRLTAITAGMELEGSIVIPGLTKTPDKTDGYIVVVKGLETDPFGREVLVAVHAAYQDEQVVYLQVEGGSVSYADRETLCKGNLELDQNSIRIQGTVSQLKEDESGFFYPSKDAINSFDIRGSRVLDVVRLQAEIDRLKEERNETLMKLSDLMNTRDTWEVLRWFIASARGHNRYLELFRRLDWKEIKRIGGIKIESLVNQLRGIVRRLNDKQFDTFDDRREYILELKRKGISRAQIHNQTDEVMTDLKKLIHLQLKLNVGDPIDDYTQNRYRNWFVRINDTYERFDTALQKTESRLPLVLIEDWLQYSDGDELDLTCTICLCEINAADSTEYLKTPCGHKFHPECIKSWLHVNSTCPSCRAQLNE